jgi:hypothetical protein
MGTTQLEFESLPPSATVDSLIPVACSDRPPPPKPDLAARRTKRPTGAHLAAIGAVVFAGASLAASAHGMAPAQPETHFGAPEIKTSDTGAPLRWKQREVVIAVDASVDAIGPDAAAAIESAFASWTKTGAQLPAFRFERTKDVRLSTTPDGRNTVLFADIDIPGHTKDVALTVSFADSNTGEILEEDIVLNSRHVIKTLPFGVEAEALSELLRRLGPCDGKDPSEVPSASTVSAYGLASVAEVCGHSYDAQNALTHEVGHFLGLGEDKEAADSTMYYRITPCETHKRALNDDDAAAVREVYKDGFDDPGEVRCEASRVGAGIPASRHGVAWMLTLVGLGIAVRRARRAA